MIYGFDFKPESYDSCRAAAQKWANDHQADFAVERFGSVWAYRRLPSPGQRYGVDLWCEVVRPEVVR